MAFDPANYPDDWKALGQLVRKRAGNTREIRGVPNGERGARDDRGRWHAEDDIIKRETWSHV